MLPLNSIDTGFRNRGLDALSLKASDRVSPGERAAMLYKYYSQFGNAYFSYNPIPFSRISARGLYLRHSDVFDKTSKFFAEHGIDIGRYMEFFAKDQKRPEQDIDTWLLSRQSLSDYMTKLQASDKKRKIYSWFCKSVSNIVDMCIAGDYMSGKDCVLGLIKSGKLAQEFMSGRISRYFLAAMPNFKCVIPKLDYFSRLELSELYDKFDIYNTEINDTFLTYRNRTVNPLDIVDAELAKKKSRLAEKKSELFDSSL